jgi:CheY-like chemotaxis protein
MHSSSNIPGKSPFILLATHEPEEAATLRHVLESLEIRYRVVWARDGLEALGVLSREPPPVLVLIEGWLPRLSGRDVLRWSQDQARLRQTRFVLLTPPGSHQPPTEALVRPEDRRAWTTMLRNSVRRAVGGIED